MGHRELLSSITDVTRTVFDAAACSVALLDEQSGELVFEAASGVGANEILGRRMPSGTGIAGWAVSSGQPIAIHEAGRHPRFARNVAESTGYVPHTILAFPLETERGMLGVLEVLDPAAGSTDGMELLSLFARQAGLAVESGLVFDDLGRALFTAAAAATQNTSVSTALLAIARSTNGPTAGLAELAGYLAELGRRGERERASATALIGQFLSYVRARDAIE